MYECLNHMAEQLSTKTTPQQQINVSIELVQINHIPYIILLVFGSMIRPTCFANSVFEYKDTDGQIQDH